MDEKYVLVSCVFLIIHHESELWEWLATRIELNVCVRKCVLSRPLLVKLCVVCVIFLFPLLTYKNDILIRRKSETFVCVRWLTTMEFFVWAACSPKKVNALFTFQPCLGRITHWMPIASITDVLCRPRTEGW